MEKYKWAPPTCPCTHHPPLWGSLHKCPCVSPACAQGSWWPFWPQPVQLQPPPKHCTGSSQLLSQCTKYKHLGRSCCTCWQCEWGTPDSSRWTPKLLHSGGHCRSHVALSIFKLYISHREIYQHFWTNLQTINSLNANTFGKSWAKPRIYPIQFAWLLAWN